MRKVQQWCIVAGQANKVGLRPRVSVKQASPTRRRPESADTLQFFMASRSSTTLSMKQPFKKLLFRSALQKKELELKLELQLELELERRLEIKLDLERLINSKRCKSLKHQQK